jgi:hypothetical protein
MTKSYKYTGILAKPMGDAHLVSAALRARSTGGADSPAWADATAEDNRLLMERLKALAEDCGVSLQGHDPWFPLVLKLCERHVPGFSREARRGRGQPKKRPDRELYDQMQQMMINKNLSARSAAVHVARDRKRGERAAAIETRYRRVKKDLEKIRVIVEKARQEIR